MPGRRRKIKCTFIHGDARCANCLARGTQCIDQRDVEGADDFYIDDSAVSLRERVTTLERQLADVLQTIQRDLRRDRALDHSPQPAEGSDIEPISDLTGKAGFNPTVSDIYAEWNYERAPAGENVRISLSIRKAGKVCKTLRACLPSLDTLLDTFSKHGSWWPHFQRQIRPEGEPMEEISAFVLRT